MATAEVGSSGGRGRGDGGGNNLILSLQEWNLTLLLMSGDRGCIREREEMGEPEEKRALRKTSLREGNTWD